MKPAIALLALFSVACGGGSSPGPTAPTTPIATTVPSFTPAQVDGGQLFTYQNAVAFLPAGIAHYKVAIVFLPGLRDPATGMDLDSRALVNGAPGGACSIWCTPAEKAEVRSRALKLAGGNVALIGTTTLIDTPASYDTLIQALSNFGTQSQQPELANIPIFFVGHSQGGCTAYGFTRVHGARVAGFLTMKGGCHSPAPPAAAVNVPGYFLIGSLDELSKRQHHGGVQRRPRGGSALDAFDRPLPPRADRRLQSHVQLDRRCPCNTPSGDVPMKPTIALLLLLFIAACGKSSDGSSGTPTTPTAPTLPTGPSRWALPGWRKSRPPSTETSP